MKQRSLFFLLFFLLQSGCTIRGTLQPPQDIPHPSAEAILEQLTTRQQAFQDLSAVANIFIDSMGSIYHLKEAFLLKDKSKIRVEDLPVFGLPTMHLTSDGDTFSIYYPGQRKYIRGIASRENIFKLVSFDLKVSEIVRLLAGDILLSWGFPAAKLTYLPQAKTYLLELLSTSGDRYQQIWIDPATLLPTYSQVYDELRSLTLRITYSNYKSVDGYLLPFTIEIIMPLKNTEIKIEYESVKFNKGVSEEMFTLAVPQGAEVISLE
ncbi:MAG: DUF4292 domain-containing protein [Candidatus Tectomicrobia bacterium]|nr:DUF4292 domain-containing protein [Candidatus Tectomicrobia bacterium]